MTSCSNSATRREDDLDTPYSQLSNPWNSEDFPNVFVLQISATPWNLQTVNSRIENIDVFQDPSTGQMSKNEIKDNYRRGKFKLNEIQWMNSHESNLKIGKECRLIVRYYWSHLQNKQFVLKFKFQRNASKFPIFI